MKKNYLKKVIIAGTFLLVPCASYAMEKKKTKETSSKEQKCIILPEASVLEKRLSEAGFDNFLKKPEIHKKLACKELYPLDVLMAVELALYDYAKDLDDPMISRIMNMRKPQLLKAILKDSTEVLKKPNEQ
jgi:hypothetical protein